MYLNHFGGGVDCRHPLGAPLSVTPRSLNQYRQVRSTVPSVMKTAVSATDGTLNSVLFLSELQPLCLLYMLISNANKLIIRRNELSKSSGQPFANTSRRVYVLQRNCCDKRLENVNGLKIFNYNLESAALSCCRVYENRKHDSSVTFVVTIIRNPISHPP